MCIGGAHSVDRQRRIAEGLPYWEDEAPSLELMAKVEDKLAEREHKIHGFLTHTCPISVLPTEMFLSAKETNDEEPEYELDINRTAEEWLESLRNKTIFEEWYCGHYHIDKEIETIVMLHKNILPFCETEEGQ